MRILKLKKKTVTEGRTTLMIYICHLILLGVAFSSPVYKRSDQQAQKYNFTFPLANAWSYTSTPQYFFMAWGLVKHRDNFTFTFTFIALGYGGMDDRWFESRQKLGTFFFRHRVQTGPGAHPAS
jgi:hypothetical protein